MKKYMKLVFLTVVLGAFILGFLSSCRKAVEMDGGSSVEEPSGKVSVTLSAYPDGETRSSVAPTAEEAAVVDVQYYALRDGKVVAYGKGSGNGSINLLLDADSDGEWEFIAQANHPESASPRLSSSDYRLSDYAKGRLLMSSARGLTYTRSELLEMSSAGKTVGLPLYIDLIRLEVTDVTIVRSASFNPTTFTVKRVYLSDVADDEGESGWLNAGGRVSAGAFSSLVCCDSGDVIPQTTVMHSFNPALPLYLKFFKGAKDGDKTIWTPTRLILEAEWEQGGVRKTGYYPFYLNSGMVSRVTYPVSLRVDREGLSSPDGAFND